MDRNKCWWLDVGCWAVDVTNIRVWVASSVTDEDSVRRLPRMKSLVISIPPFPKIGDALVTCLNFKNGGNIVF